LRITTKAKAMEVRKIEADIQVRKAGDDVEFVISTSAIDRHGTIINPEGWDLKSFRSNPIMAYQHNTHSTDPDDILGTWEIRVEDGQLVGKPVFEPSELNEKADKVRRKVEHGTLRAVSVGFIPRAWHWGDKKKGERSDVLYLDENELLEVSIVAVPSNPEALKRSVDELRKEIPAPKVEQEKVNSLEVAKARLIVNNLK
jgi:HK97 family phage prohead protease